MTRWLRLYPGTMRDPKFVSIALDAEQPKETVLFVWLCILEAAADARAKGVYKLDPREVANFLHCKPAAIEAILNGLERAGFINRAVVSDWSRYDQEYAVPQPWAKVRAAVFERDNYTCTYCGEKTDDPECDHVVPRSRGGSDDIINLATACSRCNQSKGAKLIQEWHH